MQLAQQTVAVLRRKMLAKCSLYLQRRKRLVWRSFWRDCRIIGARWRRISPPPTEDGEAHAAVYGESHSGGFSVPHRLSLSKAFPFSFQGRNCRQFRNANKRKGSTAGSSLAYPALCVRRTAFAGFCGVKRLQAGARPPISENFFLKTSGLSSIGGTHHHAQKEMPGKNGSAAQLCGKQRAIFFISPVRRQLQ